MITALTRRLDYLLLLLAVALFVGFPLLDLRISALAYARDGGFFLRDLWWVRLLYEATEYLVAAMLAGLAIALLGSWLGRPARLRQWRRHIIYLGLVLVLGPGLVVNGVFKEHWGRARPHQIAEFGAELNFSRAFEISDQCPSNCSFVSGHAAAGFSLIGLYFLTRRRGWLAAGVLAGAAIGTARVVQGGHFASDVVFSLAAVYFVAKLLHWLMFPERREGIRDSGRPPPPD